MCVVIVSSHNAIMRLHTQENCLYNIMKIPTEGPFFLRRHTYEYISYNGDQIKITHCGVVRKGDSLNFKSYFQNDITKKFHQF